MKTRRALVIAVGNTARGDDALGPLLLEHLRTLPVAERWWLTLIGDTQLQIEHALDVQINDLVVFVDACVEAQAPFEFRELVQPQGHRIVPMSHALSPTDVLHTLTALGRRGDLPACFHLTLRGKSFEFGDGLSDTARAHLQAARHFVEDLLESVDEAGWRKRLNV